MCSGRFVRCPSSCLLPFRVLYSGAKIGLFELTTKKKTLIKVNGAEKVFHGVKKGRQKEGDRRKTAGNGGRGAAVGEGQTARWRSSWNGGKKGPGLGEVGAVAVIATVVKQ